MATEPSPTFSHSPGLHKIRDRHGSGWCDFDNDGDLDLHISIGANGGARWA